MSNKPPPDARAWDRIEQQLDEADLERIASLPTEELHAEMRKAGLEPGKGKALLAAARAKVDAEMAAAPKGEPAKVVDLAAARQRRRIPTGVYVFAAAAAVALVVGLMNRDEIVAYFNPVPQPTPTVPNPVLTAPPPPTELQLATMLRERAVDDCKKGYYGECEDKMTAAGDLDSAGRDDPKWAETRKTLSDWHQHLFDERERRAKPGLGPKERRLH